MKLTKNLRLPSGTIIPAGTELHFSTEGKGYYRAEEIEEARIPQACVESEQLSELTKKGVKVHIKHVGDGQLLFAGSQVDAITKFKKDRLDDAIKAMRIHKNMPVFVFLVAGKLKIYAADTFTGMFIDGKVTAL